MYIKSCPTTTSCQSSYVSSKHDIKNSIYFIKYISRKGRWTRNEFHSNYFLWLDQFKFESRDDNLRRKIFSCHVHIPSRGTEGQGPEKKGRQVKGKLWVDLEMKEFTWDSRLMRIILLSLTDIISLPWECSLCLLIDFNRMLCLRFHVSSMIGIKNEFKARPVKSLKFTVTSTPSVYCLLRGNRFDHSLPPVWLT